MKKLLLLIALIAGVSVLNSCSEDDSYVTTWNQYSEWRQTNINFLNEQEALTDEDGNPFFSRLYAPWNPDQYILIHWFNDSAETAGNIQPLYTSVVTTAYNCRLYNDVMVDSSYSQTNGTVNFSVNSVIGGWQMALTNMHVGDSVQLVVPYQCGYGSQTSGAIPPYCTLQFNLRLPDCPAYEIQP